MNDELEIYQQPAPVEQYQAALAMTPEQAKALDAQVRACTRAVLREGTDYGVIPGTSGDKVLFRPGAQKLLQWFGMGFECQRVEVERDGDGRKHGITYRAAVGKRLPDNSLAVIATCEGSADYDEDKFYQPAEMVRRKAEAKERMWAKKDRRVADPAKWRDLSEYRAPWNALMKRAQKRAIVGATIDATAAGGIFSQDREDDDGAGSGDGDTASWYEQALETALTFTDPAEGQDLWRDSAAAARDGRCTPRHATHLQNRIRQRIELLKRTPVVDLDDPVPAQGASIPAQDDAQSAMPAETPPETPSEPAPKREAPRKTTSVLGTISGHLDRLGYAADEGLRVLSDLTGHYIGALADLTAAEAKAAAALLAKPKDQDTLEQLLAAGDKPGGADA